MLGIVISFLLMFCSIESSDMSAMISLKAVVSCGNSVDVVQNVLLIS